eukprot:TRINITY_DN3449_c0_g1_i1.p1 TRINITY_DN3449_c0_g1~~TRINITY_DN3449_c0_g1_i1.p1  ORF type:complete len:230 (+),score=18.58 TRINITY_DN3449_c0_g1_i1:248-937(+)
MATTALKSFTSVTLSAAPIYAVGNKFQPSQLVPVGYTSTLQEFSSLSLSSSFVPRGAALCVRSSRFPSRLNRGGVLVCAQVERSYVMIKPDGVQRGLVGEILGRFERKGFTLKGLKLFQCSTELAKEHYRDLSEKPFYGKLVDYIVSGPVVCMVWEGPGVVASARKLIGATSPTSAEPGTIRGDLAVEVGRNVVHGSDSIENGEREISLWFQEAEIVEWEPSMTAWLRE